MEHKYRRPIAIGVAAAAALSVTACTSGGGTGSETGDAQTLVGYSAPYLSDPYMIVEMELTVKFLEAEGFKVLPTVNADSDPALQVTQVTSLLDQGANGLVVVPVDANSIIPALDLAESKEVPVVTIDTAPAGGTVAMIIRADNVLMGAQACEYMGEEMGGQGTILQLQGMLSQSAGAERTSGFEDCMKENYPDIIIISKPTDWDPAKATDQAQTALVSNPEISGIYMQSDDVMFQGVLSVLQQAGRAAKVGEPGHIVMVGIDGGAGGLQGIRDGYIDALVSQPLDLYAKFAAYYLKGALAGETWKEGPTDHDSVISVYEGNLQDLLPAPMVTIDNVDDPGLWGNNVG